MPIAWLLKPVQHRYIEGFIRVLPEVISGSSFFTGGSFLGA